MKNEKKEYLKSKPDSHELDLLRKITINKQF